MLVPERRRRIIDLVRRKGSATIEELSRAVGVSAWTVRRDLAELEDDGLLVRTRGGAIVAALGSGDPRGAAGEPAPGESAGAKARIARRAVELAEPGSTIMVLAGSTTGAMVPALHDRRLTVVTNGLDIANGLKHAPQISLVVLGGYLHRDQMTLLGPMSEGSMAGLHVDVLFAGAWGVDPDVGVTGTKIIQAGNHVMLRHTDRLVVLADATKLGRRGPTLLAGLDEVDTLVTERSAPPEVLTRLAERVPAVETV